LSFEATSPKTAEEPPLQRMDNLIGLVNRIQRACTALGDYGGEGAVQSLWEALPTVVVVGGQVEQFISFF